MNGHSNVTKRNGITTSNMTSEWPLPIESQINGWIPVNMSH